MSFFKIFDSPEYGQILVIKEFQHYDFTDTPDFKIAYKWQNKENKVETLNHIYMDAQDMRDVYFDNLTLEEVCTIIGEEA